MERIAVITALVLLAIITFKPILPEVEGKFIPVVIGTQLRIVERHPDMDGWTIISGTTMKKRECDFVSIEWYLGTERGARSKAQVRFLEGTKTRPPTEFEWGPWAVQLTPSQLFENSSAVVTHDCHSGWFTKTTFWSSKS